MIISFISFYKSNGIEPHEQKNSIKTDIHILRQPDDDKDF